MRLDFPGYPDPNEPIRDLIRRAEANPYDVRDVIRAIRTPKGERAHRERMDGLTIRIGPYWATFSIERGHPAGTCRHLSLSTHQTDNIALWMADFLAQMFGFRGTLAACSTWLEPLRDGGTAINIVQPVPS